jgi:hypothetical protein
MKSPIALIAVVSFFLATGSVFARENTRAPAVSDISENAPSGENAEVYEALEENTARPSQARASSNEECPIDRRQARRAENYILYGK